MAEKLCNFPEKAKLSLVSFAKSVSEEVNSIESRGLLEFSISSNYINFVSKEPK